MIYFCFFSPTGITLTLMSWVQICTIFTWRPSTAAVKVWQLTFAYQPLGLCLIVRLWQNKLLQSCTACWLVRESSILMALMLKQSPPTLQPPPPPLPVQLMQIWITQQQNPTTPYHGHRDIENRPALTKPTKYCPDVYHAVKFMFQQEGFTTVYWDTNKLEIREEMITKKKKKKKINAFNSNYKILI